MSGQFQSTVLTLALECQLNGFRGYLEILGHSRSSEEHMRLVFATEAREGPNTSRQSRESHGETSSTEHALNDVVGKVPV